MKSVPSAHTAIAEVLDRHRRRMESLLDADVVAIESLIVPGLDQHIRVAVETMLKGRRSQRSRLAIVLGTDGGVAEVVERIVKVTRHHFDEVYFLVPDRAMSAGTILAMSGDEIFMDYFSVLGPIDPQLPQADGRMVPALSYIHQYEALLEKANKGLASPAEVALLLSFNQAELHQYEKARQLSVAYLKEWLTKYKFKNWSVTETNKTPVTQVMKEDRAAEIALTLNDHTRWFSHGRGLDIETLRQELNLKIRDFDSIPGLGETLAAYHQTLLDGMRTIGWLSCVHARNFF
jgi:hypothetical protein